MSELQINDFIRFEDPEEMFDIIEFIGEGNFGTVVKAKDKETNIIYSIKIIPMDQEVLDQIIPDLQFFKSLENPFMLKYYDIFFKEQNLWIQMEYCELGSLLDVQKMTNRTFNEQEISIIIYHTLRGVQYLHQEKDTCHLGLKVNNLLVTYDGNLKISDFGLTFKFLRNLVDFEHLIQMPYWMAPEMLQNGDMDKHSDIWSIGICAAELAEGQPPLMQEDPEQVLDLLTQQEYQTQLMNPQNFSEEFNDFIHLCLQQNKDQRPQISELLQHKFIKNNISASESNLSNEKNQGVLQNLISEVVQNIEGSQETSQISQQQYEIHDDIQENQKQKQSSQQYSIEQEELVESQQIQSQTLNINDNLQNQIDKNDSNINQDEKFQQQLENCEYEEILDLEENQSQQESLNKSNIVNQGILDNKSESVSKYTKTQQSQLIQEQLENLSLKQQDEFNQNLSQNSLNKTHSKNSSKQSYENAQQRRKNKYSQQKLSYQSDKSNKKDINQSNYLKESIHSQQSQLNISKNQQNIKKQIISDNLSQKNDIIYNQQNEHFESLNKISQQSLLDNIDDKKKESKRYLETDIENETVNFESIAQTKRDNENQNEENFNDNNNKQNQNQNSQLNQKQSQRQESDEDDDEDKYLREQYFQKQKAELLARQQLYEKMDNEEIQNDSNIKQNNLEDNNSELILQESKKVIQEFEDSLNKKIEKKAQDLQNQQKENYQEEKNNGNFRKSQDVLKENNTQNKEQQKQSNLLNNYSQQSQNSQENEFEGYDLEVLENKLKKIKQDMELEIKMIKEHYQKRIDRCETAIKEYQQKHGIPQKQRKNTKYIIKQIANLPFSFQVDDELTQKLNQVQQEIYQQKQEEIMQKKYQEYMQQQQQYMPIQPTKNLPFEFAPNQNQNQNFNTNISNNFDSQLPNQPKIRNNPNDPSSMVGFNSKKTNINTNNNKQDETNNSTISNQSNLKPKKTQAQLPFSFQPLN